MSLTLSLAIAGETNRGKFYIVVAEFSILYYRLLRLCNFRITNYCSKISRKKGRFVYFDQMSLSGDVIRGVEPFFSPREGVRIRKLS